MVMSVIHCRLVSLFSFCLHTFFFSCLSGVHWLFPPLLFLSFSPFLHNFNSGLSHMHSLTHRLMLPAISEREKQWDQGLSVFSPPGGAFDGARGSQGVWRLEGQGVLGGQQAAVPPPNPVTPSWVVSWGGAAGTCHGERQRPLGPAVAFGWCGGAGLLLSRTCVELFRGPLRWNSEILYRCWCLNGHAHTDAHRHNSQKDLYSCVKGTPPFPNAAAALCEALSSTHRWLLLPETLLPRLHRKNKVHGDAALLLH